MIAAHRRVSGILLPLLVSLAAGGCAPETPRVARPPNLLVIVADDVGTDRVGIYGEAADPGRTPNIDELGRTGLVFERFWTMPSCSVARAALLTGQYPHRTGVGAAVRPSAPPEAGRAGLATELEILPRGLAHAGYASAIVGKWHLGARSQGLDHPLRMGFGHHRGSFGNLSFSGGRPGYSRWTKLVDGVEETSHVYATTDSVDDAIALGGELEEPWLLVVSFNAAHKPLHVPPAELHGYRELASAREQRGLAFRAMVEAMDTEIGRLLAALSPQQPFVFFLGDNGTDDSAYEAGELRRGRVKGSLYEGGVRVPLIVNHPSIVAPGRRIEALASVTDLFATLVELAERERPPRGLPADSVSLAPHFRSAAAEHPRGWLLAESFFPNGPGPYERHGRAVSDRRYKLIRFGNGKEHFYDLVDDPDERRPLPVAGLRGGSAEAYERLLRILEAPPALNPASAGG